MFIEELVPNVNLETAEIEFKGLIEEGSSPSGPAKEISWIKTLADLPIQMAEECILGLIRELLPRKRRIKR